VTELGLLAVFGIFLVMGFRRPFVWVLLYLWVDILAPQLIGYRILPLLPVSQIAFAAAFSGWLLIDDKTDSRFTWRQGLLILLLIYCGLTTLGATFEEDAAGKWSWVWKALLFAIFLPLTLRTRLRLEAATLVITLSIAAIIIDGGIKTVISGGGYGTMQFFVSNNIGLYESSIISTVAISVIPITIWLARHGTIFPSDWRVWTFACALVFACALIPVGTAARTGLICLLLLCVLYLRTVKHRILIGAAMALAGLVAIPFLPSAYTQRMSTIENHAADESASTRLAVWAWTLDYVKSHPFGGGFEIYRANKLSYETVDTATAGATTMVETKEITENGRAFHSSYFEMLGEQGWPGLFIWLLLQVSGLWQMEIVRRRYRKREEPEWQWTAPFANALQLAHIVYLAGSAFVGIAFQPFIYMLIGLQCGLWTYLRRVDPVVTHTHRELKRGVRAAPVAEVG
jgi:probable O-glycosylation ligase (exosortase A-associated)